MARTKTFDEEAVLEKAMHLFWKQGYHATSMQELVDHLGINRASLYNTYGGKRELFDRAFVRYASENKARLKAYFQSRPSIKQAFSELFERAVLQGLAADGAKGCFVVNCTAEFLPEDNAMLEVLSRNREEFEHLFADILEMGKQRGEFSPSMDARVIAAYLFTFYSGLNVIAKLEPSREEVQAIISEGLRILQ